jgi:hypothetical protein
VCILSPLKNQLNAYTYGDPNWFPDMDPKLREMFDKVTKGSLSGLAGQPAKQDWKVNGEYVDTLEKGVVGIPFLDKYVATVPQIFDLWQDPQERYDIFMTNFTERTWTLVTFNEAIGNLMKTYVKYPPRKLQSEVYTGPLTLMHYERFKWVREQLEKKGVNLPMPTGN